ncbi:hypothetical protein [Nonomuraea jiangxiensis]|uniref:Low molecular weight phosphotyrosine protein phosphatase n=1 Tax=Nonomuraea jiangxiensis TaxID=633440 RepID=A0A1G9GHM4_9ACTN|nr:hypothetical protein [Nonomuraea jiangxiensis]SDL00156.1 Low molecular weight phosphotyrosine protein phosphatase [Nonomuraea jiangxiensis]
MSDEFGILPVCTADICRSAMAEVITRAMLRSTAQPMAVPMTVAGAGVSAPTGHAMAPHAITTLDRLGLDPAAERRHPRRAAQLAWLTVDMLKSGTRTAGMTVRWK